MMRARCVLTVAGLMNRRSPIWSLFRPRATNVRISRSRSVSWSMPRAASPAGTPGRAATNVSMSRRVMDGSMSASPAATTRTADAISSGSASLRRKPPAPADSASYTYSSRSNVVRMSTCTSARTALERMARVASMPLTRGMRMSMSTTSGRRRSASCTA